LGWAGGIGVGDEEEREEGEDGEKREGVDGGLWREGVRRSGGEKREGVGDG